MNSDVERAAAFIWSHYSEPLTLADIAKSATLSRFHLCRIFPATTGVTPCRFLSAVRIYQAKHMLLTTPVRVTDLAFAVGYNSVGSFTSQFTSSVGMPPGMFRRKAQGGDFEFPRPGRDGSPVPGAVHGTISLPRGHAGARVYLGAFSTALVQRPPADAAVVDIPAAGRPSSYCLRRVPAGTWFIHAVEVAGGTDREPWPRGTALVGGRGPVSVAVRTTTLAPVSLRPRRMTDPPVLLALPELEPWTTSPTPAEGAPNLANGRAPCGRS
jgi:AraC family transcriptional regulator